ncbi:uroporphyrinogen-III synthase [Brevundimonas subvibrioides]|uniref:Uroporphyrinogen III synthase HEM4 n=1 Tax=Brevundimonas subvibrioides (strain ATCC 15264 / DSM 4735 / LMG 14903 / NBRC 16000 / CB 81) TaxID=633149 RepID=D9QJX1_BRESC|nr:uroporphyrinogen-III synthase [Brevundimonas subvibrioides]ADK99722.1 Uroporphyrinogen III synthase HEM4 [Brevundimonas subvibrioides ATCC 15264]
MADRRRVWVTRARPGADRTAERLTTLGHTPLVVPLLAIRPLDVALDLDGVQALAFTSLNGVAAFAALSTERALPVLAVGDATARAAREAGFASVRSADGDLQALAALVRSAAPGQSVLHPGALEPAGDLAAAVGDAARVRSIAVYGAQETGAAPPGDWDTVLIHSPRAGRALAIALGDRPTLRLALAISAAAAEPLADAGFAEIRIAAAPTEAALLAALGNPRAGV